MHKIKCPFCGHRDEHEFQYGGEAHIARPANPDQLDDEEWADYVFNRTNPKGWHYERWLHEAGCGRWFNTIRNTKTHEFYLSYKINIPKPELPE